MGTGMYVIGIVVGSAMSLVPIGIAIYALAAMGVLSKDEPMWQCTPEDAFKPIEFGRNNRITHPDPAVDSNNPTT